MALTRRSLLIAAAGALAACSTRKEFTGDAGGRRTDGSGVVPQPVGTDAATGVPRFSLGMVGDSITLASKPALTEVLAAAGFTEITIDAEQSRRIEVGNGRDEPLSGRRVLTRLIDEQHLAPSVWVFALGTNDVGSYRRDGYAELIDTLLAMPAPGVPIVWVDTYRPAAMDATLLFNEVLRERAGQRPNAVVASWFAIASDPANRVLRSDRIHPNQAGQQAFAALVADAVRALG